MYGRAWTRILWWCPLLVSAVLAGCDGELPARQTQTALPDDASSAFDDSHAGGVAGRVTWAGEIPAPSPFRAPFSPQSEEVRGPDRDWTNPNIPVVDPQSRGVGNAVVFLLGVDPRRARPWDLPPAHVELRDFQVHVRQGGADGPYGFVRRGDAITLSSKLNVFQSVKARGAAFFAYTLPVGGPPRPRVLDERGVVELTSGSGQFWMRGYLFVDDHPYYARTDADGRFMLPKAPPGDYDLVCWMPDWREASHEIDAETRLITRLTFRPPLRVVRGVHIEPGATATADFVVSLDTFGGRIARSAKQGLFIPCLALRSIRPSP